MNKNKSVNQPVPSPTSPQKGKRKGNRRRKRTVPQQNKIVSDPRKQPAKRQVQPDFIAIPAANVLSTIPIVATMCPFARSTWSCALISRLSALDTDSLNQIYYVYQAMDADFVATVQSETPVLTNRVAFVNTLYELVKAKTVHSPRLDVSYQFDSTTLSGAPNPFILIRGQNFYMYNPGTDDGVHVSMMVVPPAVTLPVAIQSYNEALPSLVGNVPKKMLVQQKADEASKVFTHDASGFAQRATYVNSAGGCPSGGYASAELEVYGKGLSYLSTFVQLPSTVLRTAQYLQFASTDTTTTFGLPYLDSFNMLDYSSKLAPIVKYVDLSQLWAIYAEWFGETLRKGYDLNTDYTNTYLATPVPLAYAIIAFRQSIVKFFQPVQACTQFQGYEFTANGGFEGLRLGTNAASRINIPLNLPLLLCENLRGLAPKRYCRSGKNGDKNCRWYLPCIGLYNTTFWDNPNIDVGGANFPVFDPVVPAELVGINYVDGSTNAGVADLNSEVIKSVIFELNQNVSFNSQVSGGVGFPEGSSDFNLLAFTRYDEFSDASLDDEFFDRESSKRWNHSPFTPHLKRYYDAKKNEDRQVFTLEKSKSKSAKKFSIKLRDGTLNYVPRAYSSSIVITKELMQIIETLVVPSVVTYEAATVLTVTKYGFQSAFSEPQNYAVNQPVGNTPAVLGSVAASLANLGKALAPGTAAVATPEVARALAVLQQKDKGGFMQAALSGLFAFAENL